MRVHKALISVAAVTVFGMSAPAFAQCAGCSADFNKAEREKAVKEAQVKQIRENDKPLRTDYLGNALIGGAIRVVK